MAHEMVLALDEKSGLAFRLIDISKQTLSRELRKLIDWGSETPKDAGAMEYPYKEMRAAFHQIRKAFPEMSVQQALGMSETVFYRELATDLISYYAVSPEFHRVLREEAPNFQMFIQEAINDVRNAAEQTFHSGSTQLYQNDNPSRSRPSEKTRNSWEWFKPIWATAHRPNLRKKSMATLGPTIFFRGRSQRGKISQK